MVRCSRSRRLSWPSRLLAQVGACESGGARGGGVSVQVVDGQVRRRVGSTRPQQCGETPPSVKARSHTLAAGSRDSQGGCSLQQPSIPRTPLPPHPGGPSPCIPRPPSKSAMNCVAPELEALITILRSTGP